MESLKLNCLMIGHFVGRNQPLHELYNFWESSMKSQGHLVLIPGEPGIGKTTLVEKFLTEIKERCPNVGIVRAKSSEIYGEDLPFFLFREALKELLTAKDKDGKMKKTKLYDFVKDVGGAWLGIIPIVGSIAGAVFETGMGIKDNLLKKSNEQKVEMFGSFLSILERITKDQPLIMFFDDLHWSDRSSLELLHYLARVIDNYPLLIIGTYRPHEIEICRGEQLHPLKVARGEMCRYRLCHEIPLNLFDISECNSLLDSIFSDNTFPYSFKELVFNKTEGNPLFINEILLLLSDKGIITQENSQWGLVEDLYDIDIPGTLEDIINERFQKIEDELKKYLKLASIEGEEFSSIVLSGLLNIEDELIVFDKMEQAEKTHQMVHDKGAKEFPQGETTELYSFSHKLFHKIIYKNLNEKQKEILHRKVGEILEAKYIGYESEISPELARHFEIGRSFEKAVKYYEFAASQAQSLHCYEDVLINCQKGLKILERMGFPLNNTGTRISLLLKTGQASERLSRWDEGLKVLYKALELCGSMEFYPIKANVMLYIGWMKFDQGNWDEAKSYFEESLVLFQEINDLEGTFFALNRLGSFHEKKCELDQAYQLYQRCSEIATQLNQKGLIATSYGLLGDIFAEKNEWDKALSYYEKEKRLAEETDDLPELARATFNIGFIYKNKGEWDMALELFTQSTTILEKLGNLSALATRLRHMGDVAEKKGEWQQAEAYYKKAKEIYEKIGDKEGLGESLNDIGWLYSYIGNTKESLLCFEKVLEIAQEIGDKRSKSSAYNNIGLFYYDMGELDKALEFLEKSRYIDEEIGDKKGMGRSYNNIGLIYYDMGEFSKALEFFEKDKMIAENLGDRWGVSTGLCNIGLIHYYRKEFDRALEFYEADFHLCNELGDKPGEAQALTNIASVYIKKKMPEKASECLTKSETLFIQCGEKYTLIETYRAFTELKLLEKNFTAAHEYCNKGLKMAEAISRKEMIAENYNLLGMIYHEENNMNLAYQYYQKAIELVETSIIRLLPAFYKNLASLFKAMENLQEAIEYYRKCCELYKKMNAPIPIAEINAEIETLSR